MAKNNPFALSFDGVDDSLGPITLPQSLRCIEFYFQVGSDYVGSGEPANQIMHFGSMQHILFLGANDISPAATMTLRLRSDAPARYVYSYITKPILAGTHHVAILWKAALGRCSFVLDGEEIETTYYSTASSPLYQSSFKISAFQGELDELRVWGVTRSSEDIQGNMYKSLVGDEAGLILYWRLDEESGNSALDSSPSGLDATIYGATRVGGLVDLEGLTPPGRVDISATLRGSSSFRIGEPERIRGLSANLKGSSLITAKPERIRGLSATLQGSSSVSARMNLIASLKAHLQGKATLKSTMLVLFIPSGVYVIDADEIFDRNQPMRSQSFANYIEVKVNPLKPVAEPEEVYKSSEPFDIAAGETKTISIQFKSKPVIEAIARIENAPAGTTISNVKYYAWGADVTITSPAAGTFDLIVDGKPLKVQGEEIVVVKDEQSILENGIKKYTFDNPFVQDRATAKTIGQHLLKFADPRSDIAIDWRGDPAVVLADVTMVPEYQRDDIDQRGVYYITKQELEFDGGLRVQTEGRKM